MIRFGVLGLGFMGRTHVAAILRAALAGLECRLHAVCDVQPQRGGASLGANNLSLPNAPSLPEDVVFLTAAADLFSREEIDAVCLCTPTDTHVELTERALYAGKHVLLEKPVALSCAEVDRLRDAEKRSGRHVMPAFCVRYWPGWSWLVQQVRSGAFGVVRSAAFSRMGQMPTWSGFYADELRSGGALFDLHVHDADFLLHAFGAPQSVSSAGSTRHILTTYMMANGPAPLTAEGGWIDVAGFEFRMTYRAIFDEAVAVYDIRRDPVLRLTRGGETSAIELDALTGYDHQLRDFAHRLLRGEPPAVTLADAWRVTHLLESERLSLTSGAPVLLDPAIV